MDQKLTAEQVVGRLVDEAEEAYARYKSSRGDYDAGKYDGLQSAAELVRQHLCDKEASE